MTEKTQKNIFIAFILNLGFAIFEFIGGALTNSVAIMSDAIHDIGDALSIGFSFILEKTSKKQPDNCYTYGYLRYSVIGSLITNSILLTGSAFVIYKATLRFITPQPVNYAGMLGFAVVGVTVNLLAAFVTRDGDSLNQRAVSLHMLEDVLGWALVLIGALIMKYTDITIIDPILSIFVALFILYNAGKNFKEVIDLFLEKAPDGISIDELTEHLTEISGVKDVHHIHIRSLDGINNLATLHAVIDGNAATIKKAIKAELAHHGISHTTIETEEVGEECSERHCSSCHNTACHHHHHHGHHHH